jgi:hypothetical protein
MVPTLPALRVGAAPLTEADANALLRKVIWLHPSSGIFYLWLRKPRILTFSVRGLTTTFIFTSTSVLELSSVHSSVHVLPVCLQMSVVKVDI